MLGYSFSDVEANIGQAQVELSIADLPEHYIAKAYLVDENYAALCEEYVSYQETTAYEKFLEKEPEDFSDDREIIIFDDEKAQTDFAVLTDGAVITESGGSMTFSYNEATHTYTFQNAVPEVKALNAGDIYYYQYGDKSNEFLLLKVADVNVRSSTVTVVENTDIGLADVFEFVRIDAQGDYSDVTIDESELGEALSVMPKAKAKAKDPEFNYNESNSWGTTLSLKYKIKPEDKDANCTVGAEIS